MLIINLLQRLFNVFNEVYMTVCRNDLYCYS